MVYVPIASTVDKVKLCQHVCLQQIVQCSKIVVRYVIEMQ